MKRCIARLTLLALVGLFSISAVSGQTVEPVWLTIRRAEKHADDGEFALAIRSFRLALELDSGNPDALLGLARVFRAVGDIPEAFAYLEDSLEQRNRFSNPDYGLVVRYERAELYRMQRNFAALEQELSLIIAEGAPTSLPPALYRVIPQEGLDRILVLYRETENGSTKARGMLAEVLTGLGRYSAAAELATVAVVQQFTTILNALKHKDPTFTLTTLDEALALGAGDSVIGEYLAAAGRSDSGIYHDLYYLGASLYGESRSGYREAWSLLTRAPGAGNWAVRARVQLDDPRVEPLLEEVR